MTRGEQSIGQVFEVDRLHFAGSLSVTAAQDTSSDLEQPGAEQCAIPKLFRLYAPRP